VGTAAGRGGGGGGLVERHGGGGGGGDRRGGSCLPLRLRRQVQRLAMSFGSKGTGGA